MEVKRFVPLQTARLDLIPATLEHVLAELNSPEQLALRLKATVEAGWPPGEYDRNAQEFFRDRLLESGCAVVGWYGWYGVRREDSLTPAVLIGAGGYMGPPTEDGDLEIGFSIMPSWRNQGLATEMATALVSNAFHDTRVQRVLAHTDRENKPSIKTLTKSGFRFIDTDEATGLDLFQISKSQYILQ